MRHLFIVLLLAGVCAASPPPQDSKPVAISPDVIDQKTQEVTVVFKGQLPKTISEADLKNPSKWIVIVQLKGGSPVSYQPTSVSGASVKNRYAILKFPPNTLKGWISLLVSFDKGSLASASVAPTTGPFSAASSKSDSDEYLSGSYSPALHSAASYTIDAKGSLDIIGLLAKPDSNPKWSLGPVATVATDNRPTADPDSFVVSAWASRALINNRFLWQRAEGVLFSADLASLEFDRQNTNKTFISGLSFQIPIRLSSRPNPGTRFFMGMLPNFGVETGTNLSNALNPNGSGVLLRGVAGSSASITEKTNWKYVSEIAISASYTARIPTTNEIFTNTHYISSTGKTVTIPVMSSQVRNHLTDELDLTIAKPFSITIKHEYGELPPGFRTVHNKVTIGLTMMLKQNGTPLDSANQSLMSH